MLGKFSALMSAFGGKADIGWIAEILALRGHFGDSDVADAPALRCVALSTPTRPEPKLSLTGLPTVFPAAQLGRYFAKSA